MSDAIRTTIDRAGRLVVPKSIRDQAGLQPGTAVDVRYAGGKIEVEPVPLRIRLVQEGPLLVAEALEPVEPLTGEQVQQLLDQMRRKHVGLDC